MAFSVSKSRPFRSLGLYKSSGKHAAPKGSVPGPRHAPEPAPVEAASEQAAPKPGPVRRPAHAATSPRLNRPGAYTRYPSQPDDPAGKAAA